MLFFLIFIKESPKFVYASDSDKAIKILNEIAVINKKDKLVANSLNRSEN